uniref:Integrase catalytic domain-containing protein n=1 Tax=Takifugu rubripes TaxID=31033 RepID=A0A674PBZ4_TAKRU
MTHPVPHRPYYKVGTDLFDWDGKSYIVVTDYFSNFPEVGMLQSTSSKTVISYLKTVFARHGVPCELFSDNGPQFSSGEFAVFAKEWGFKHTTPSPTYPKSNGLAESSVKTVKNLLKKSQTNDSFQKSLLIYRSTPLQNGLSPAQMLMGRRIRSNLPVCEDLLTPKGASRIRKSKEGQKEKQAPGDNGHIRSTGTWQQTGQVQEEVAPRSYRVQVDSGLLLRRNRIDLQLQQSQRDTVAQEAGQQDTAGSAEPAGSGPDRADHGLTKVQASPPAAGLSRPKRHVQPPKRLIETC